MSPGIGHAVCSLSVAKPLVDPDIAWAKLAALTEGARIAGARYWQRPGLLHKLTVRQHCTLTHPQENTIRTGSR